MAGRDIIEPRRDVSPIRMVRVRQRWQQPDIVDLEAAMAAELEGAGALERIRGGQRIAITAGSRGIAAMPRILRAIVDLVKARGAQPFIFPAMGSHGGGTADGQVQLLADLGIDESSMGAPIESDMTVVEIGSSRSGLPVYLDAIAAKADGIIVVNRVKKHTNYDGAIESGLCKMACIGMGKHRQAVTVHRYGNEGLRRYIPEVAACVFERAPVLVGLALIENARGGVAELHGLRADEIVAREPALLERAKALSPKIPFRDIDIAVVERLGKDISGTGMDCYVIGRKRIIGEPEWPEAPAIGSLIVLDITSASHGNALGVGLADFTTQRLVSQIDWQALRANILTSGNLERGKIPLAYDTDRAAVEAAAFRERHRAVEDLRVVALRDTLHLEEMLVSRALLTDIGEREDLVILGDAKPLPFDTTGCWISPF